MPQRRVIAYVDGFNLYHAIQDIQPHSQVNLWSLMEDIKKPEEALVGVKYFSAYAKWNKSRYRKHQHYVKNLQDVGVDVFLGQFKEKKAYCNSCKLSWIAHEEKQTDINIALHMLLDAIDDRFDRAYLISADSDLVAAVRLVRNRFPEKGIMVLTPPNRYRIARSLRESAHASMEIRKPRITKNLFN